MLVTQVQHLTPLVEKGSYSWNKQDLDLNKQAVSYISCWEPEGRYQYSMMFCWEPEGRSGCTKSMVIAPFWFSMELCWTVLMPFWFSANDIIYTGWPKKTEHSIFLGLCSDQQLSYYPLLDRASFPHYNNTKIIKFGWELFILWVISYGLSFSGFAISLSLYVPWNSGHRANPANDNPQEITHKIKSSQPNLMILVLV